MANETTLPVERKLIARFDLKLLEDSPHGGFNGYVSVFGNEDSYGDIIEPGAFKETIQDFIKDGFIAVGHDWGGLPVATVVEAYEDDYGLFMRCEFHSTEAAQSARTVVRERMARGKTVGLSIGYEVKEYAIIKPEDGSWGYKRRLIKIKLYEGSIVTVPANALAGVTDAKGHGQTLNAQYDAALAAVEAVTRRIGSLADLKHQEGKRLNPANRERLETLAASVAELLAATVPPPPAPDPATVAALNVRMLALETDLLAS